MVSKFFTRTTDKIGKEQTQLPEEFLKLEEEIYLRHEGLSRLYQAGNCWAEALNRKVDGDNKNKCLPIENLGQVMTNHGGELPQDSEYAAALFQFGQALQKIGQHQNFFANRLSTCYLDVIERYLVQMKDFHTARKKLENRRTTYDSLLHKSMKAKKEDPRLEEDLRFASYKFQESSEDVHKRMKALKSADSSQYDDLLLLLQHQIDYFQESLKVLQQLHQLVTQSNKEEDITIEEVQDDKLYSDPIRMGTVLKDVKPAEALVALVVQNEEAPKQTIVRAKYTFLRRTDEELQLETGELARVTKEINKDWLYGEKINNLLLPTGQVGMFPANYCEVVSAGFSNFVNTPCRQKTVRRIMSDTQQTFDRQNAHISPIASPYSASSVATFTSPKSSSSGRPNALKVKKPLPQLPKRVSDLAN